MAILCTTPSGQITNIDRAEGNDLTAQFTMRYKLESEPDSAYVPVTTTKNILGVIFPYFDMTTVDPGTYIVHTFYTSEGDTTGTKVTVVVECGDVGI